MKFYGPAIVTIVHGEDNTLYSVVDTGAPDPEQPAVIRMFGTQQHGLYAKKTAQFVCDLLNDLEIVRQPDCPNLERSEP